MTHITHTFKWTASDEEDVYVTGTFDNWSKSNKLEKTAHGTLEKTVSLSMSEKISYKYVVNGNWVVDPNTPSERDTAGNENNILTVDDLQKMTVVGTTGDHSASALSKEEEGGKAATVESAAPVGESTQSMTETDDNVAAKSAALTEATEEAETQSSMTDQVKEKILEVTAPVTAAVAATGAAVGAAGAAVVDFMTGSDDTERETSPIPGTFPETPALEKEETSTLPVVDEVQKSDDEPVPGVVVPISSATDTAPVPETSSTEPASTHNLETVALATGAGAAAAGGFAVDAAEKEHQTTSTATTETQNDFAKAVAADKEANTAPTATYIPSSSWTSDVPETNSGFGILPVPSATAPEGTKPLAKSTYKDPETTADVGSLVPVPVKEKEISKVPESKDFEPVTSETNIMKSAETITAAPVVGTVAAVETPEVATATTDATADAISKTAQLKDAALKTSEHAAHTAAKALNPEISTPAPIDPKTPLSSFIPGAGVTAIGTATDNESEETGLARMVVRKTENNVDVQTDARAATVEPAIELDSTKMSKPVVENLGESGAVASTPVTVSVPTRDGVQSVTALGTAIVTDGGKSATELKKELENNGTHLPEGALAHLTPKVDTTTAADKDAVSETTTAPATPQKQPSTPLDTPTKTPVTQASASKEDRPVSGVPSEPDSAKKKKGGFLRRLKKALS